MLLKLLQLERDSACAVPMHDLSPRDWEEMLALALSHGVAPLLCRTLQRGGTRARIPDYIRKRLDDERHATALINLRKYGEFRRIAQALRERNIPLIALKGLHLAELIYRDISLRPMSDLDILVPRHEVERTIAALQSIEYGFEEDVSSAARGMLGTKCNIGLAHRRLGLWVEIHWTLAEPGDCYAPPMEEIWRSAAPVQLGDADTQVMSPEFLLLHVCAHLACNHVFGFDLHALCDIAEIVQAQPRLDWEVFADQGRRHGWTRGVAAALRLAHDHLGANIPAKTMAALGADALDPDLLADAMEHLLTFSGMPGELVTAPNLLAVGGGATPWAKCAMLWNRVFVPRAELSLLYGVPEHSPRLGLYYAVRLRDLFRKYAGSAWALNVSDPRLAAVAARNARLARWITGG
jgi:Uncharacterised nucleotidyltransferase